MPDEVRMWRVETDRSLVEIQRAALDLEARLQQWLAQDISVLDPRLLVIGREVETDYGGYIDLLCIDEVGDLVIVELKREKTPRQTTAQALDYGSWVAELSHEQVVAIATRYLGEGGLERSFMKQFKKGVPELLNGEHRMVIVGSHIDTSSERIIRYLSDQYGVNINAATFQYFRASDGGEFLSRVFLIEPSEVDRREVRKGSSKRRPNLTYEELTQAAKESGVAELYERAVSCFERSLQKLTTRTSIAFSAIFDGSRKIVISLFPGDSSADDGLRYHLYKNRFATLVKLPDNAVVELMPAIHDYWIYYPSAGADFEGFQGFIRNPAEIDRLVGALGQRIPRPAASVP